MSSQISPFLLFMTFKTQHLTNDISSRDRKRKYIRKLFKKLAHAFTHKEFQKVYEKIIKVEYPEATNFLATVPPEHFANAYFLR